MHSSLPKVVTGHRQPFADNECIVYSAPVKWREVRRAPRCAFPYEHLLLVMRHLDASSSVRVRRGSDDTLLVGIGDLIVRDAPTQSLRCHDMHTKSLALGVDRITRHHSMLSTD